MNNYFQVFNRLFGKFCHICPICNFCLLCLIRPIGNFCLLCLIRPFARTSAKQSRAFSVMGPSIWNGLPSQLRIFPRALSPAFFLNLRLLF